MITTILNILVLVSATISLIVSCRFYLQATRREALARYTEQKTLQNLIEAQSLTDELNRRQAERLREGLL